MTNDVRYEIAYTPENGGERHERWLVEWGLGWLDREDVVYLGVSREDDGAERRIRVVIDFADKCDEGIDAARPLLEELRRRSKRLEVSRSSPSNATGNGPR